MNMFYFKSCPRCKGDIELANDWFGLYLACLQCGFMRNGADRRPENKHAHHDQMQNKVRTIQRSEMDMLFAILRKSSKDPVSLYDLRTEFGSVLPEKHFDFLQKQGVLKIMATNGHYSHQTTQEGLAILEVYELCVREAGIDQKLGTSHRGLIVLRSLQGDGYASGIPKNDDIKVKRRLADLGYLDYNFGLTERGARLAKNMGPLIKFAEAMAGYGYGRKDAGRNPDVNPYNETIPQTITAKI